MVMWPSKPVIYEINSWAWLHELTRRHEQPITLANVPDKEWDALARAGFDAVWLMGVWERSPLGASIANQTPAMVEEFRRTLRDFTQADNVGSPYCIRRYLVDEHLGGPEALATAREALSSRGLRLILDYVPNHVALDHPALGSHPEFFVRGDAADLEREPDAFFEVKGNVIARGRDPNFPPWPDVAQINAFSAGARQAAAETVSSIAAQCDGVRCDMAMLMMTDIFLRTWGERVGPVPDQEFWPQLIETVRWDHPEMLFIAEAYWDLEYALQAQGFDYCYDKRLYDRLAHENADSIRDHLRAGLDYQGRLLRFIENHDEPRAAATFMPVEREQAAAVVSSTLPGACLFYDGQFDGRRIHTPVFLGRSPAERDLAGLRKFYLRLLQGVARSGKDEQSWHLCDVYGWPDNESCHNLLAWSWQKGDEHTLIVVNYSDQPAQGLVQPGWIDLESDDIQLEDPIADQVLQRQASDIDREGLYVDLGPWGVHYFIASARQVAAARVA
jgi:glycosidase